MAVRSQPVTAPLGSAENPITDPTAPRNPALAVNHFRTAGVYPTNAITGDVYTDIS